MEFRWFQLLMMNRQLSYSSSFGFPSFHRVDLFHAVHSFILSNITPSNIWHFISSCHFFIILFYYVASDYIMSYLMILHLISLYRFINNVFFTGTIIILVYFTTFYLIIRMKGTSLPSITTCCKILSYPVLNTTKFYRYSCSYIPWYV